jgi:23S rRNA (uracil1939-C5)-methyltransferase
MRSESTATARVIDLTHEGKGVADVDGRKLFVAGALPGEDVVIPLHKGRRRNKYDVEPLAIEGRAAERVEPPCEFFGRCGGCAVQHMNYDAQIAFKQNVVAQAFARIAGLSPESWLEPVRSEPWGYRRRARLGARYVEAKARVLVGFRERAAAYITDMNRCPVLVPPLDAAIGPLAETLSALDARQRIPQIEVALGDASGAMVVRALDQLSEEDSRRLADFGSALGLDVYVQTGGPGSIRAITATRPLYYDLQDFGVRLEFAPTDFIQVNARINERMVAEAILRAEIRPTDRVLDLFCGIGNFSLPLARHAGNVVGVEGEAGLVARAVHNARANGIGNATFLTADLSKNGWSFLGEPWDVVMLDPPRSGAAAIAGDWGRMGPRRIIYVSCHPASLARDARDLVEQHGYRLSSARIFDMFPNTHHVEAMAVFDRA